MDQQLLLGRCWESAPRSPTRGRRRYARHSALKEQDCLKAPAWELVEA